MTDTLSVEDPIEYALDEVAFTKICLRTIAYFPARLVAFEELENDGKAIRDQAASIRNSIFEAEIIVKLRDSNLNRVCTETLARLDTMSDSKERDGIRLKLIGNKAPSVFIRPILSGQLQAMKAWPAIMSVMSFDALKSYAPTVQAAVDEATVAAADLEAKEAVEDNFYFVGEYKKYIDRLNAARKSLESEAEAYRHAHPELNLPRDFSASLFRKRERDKALSIPQLDKRITQVESVLAKLKAEHSTRLEEANAEEEARKAAERQAKLTRIAQKEKEAALLAEQLAALKAELS